LAQLCRMPFVARRQEGEVGLTSSLRCA